jgi:hypothetical protein
LTFLGNKSKLEAKEIAKVECEGHPHVKFVTKTKCQPKAITLGLIERLTKNSDPVCTREKAMKKKNEYMETK